MATDYVKKSRDFRNIGEPPNVKNPERKDSCERNFRLFCETYFHQSFTLKWSDDHLKVIAKIEQAVLNGGLFALALPRGSGKTTLCICACIWAMLYGHREFIVLIGASETASVELLESIKSELVHNELLSDDFPEVCYPIARLGGIAMRCKGQHINGKNTEIIWTGKSIALPNVEGSKASGTVVRVAGITGRIRGMTMKKADGRTIRPSLVIVDDPQTTESAGSTEQNRKRVKTLEGDILGLAGAGQKISGIMPCTVIHPGDMAEQILDNQEHPDWNGVRMKMLYSFPENMELWNRYAEIRADSFREHGDFRDATQFYKEHREEMDKGAKVAWEERYNHDEISGLQHAMNLRLQSESAFLAEYQNEPIKESLGTDEIISPDELARKLNGIERMTAPFGTTKITMFVDVQKALLFYAVIAWQPDFTGAIIDYGTFPEQRTRIFTLDKALPTMQTTFKGMSLEAQIYNSLKLLMTDKLKQEYKCDDGSVLHIDKAAIDANWGLSTEIIYQFVREFEFGTLIYPSHGKYYGASSAPITSYKRKVGETIGLNWIIPKSDGRHAVRHIVYDTNYWKTFIHSRLNLASGERSSLTLYGRDPNKHELISHHLTAEYRVRTSGLGRVVDEWKLRPERMDNHWFDCVVGCAVLASTLGCSLPEFEPIAARGVSHERKVLSSLQGNRRTDYGTGIIQPQQTQERQRIKLSDLRK